MRRRRSYSVPAVSLPVRRAGGGVREAVGDMAEAVWGVFRLAPGVMLVLAATLMIGSFGALSFIGIPLLAIGLGLIGSAMDRIT